MRSPKLLVNRERTDQTKTAAAKKTTRGPNQNRKNQNRVGGQPGGRDRSLGQGQEKIAKSVRKIASRRVGKKKTKIRTMSEKITENFERKRNPKISLEINLKKSLEKNLRKNRKSQKKNRRQGLRKDSLENRKKKC